MSYDLRRIARDFPFAPTISTARAFHPRSRTKPQAGTEQFPAGAKPFKTRRACTRYTGANSYRAGAAKPPFGDLSGARNGRCCTHATPPERAPDRSYGRSHVLPCAGAAKPPFGDLSGARNGRCCTHVTPPERAPDRSYGRSHVLPCAGAAKPSVETCQVRVTDAVAPTQLIPSAHLTGLTGMVYSVAQLTRQFRVSLWAVIPVRFEQAAYA